MTHVLDVTTLAVSSGSGRRLLDQISFGLRPGERLGIIGESGSGKTLIAQAITGLLAQELSQSGSILFTGQELHGLDQRSFARVRARSMGMVFAEPMTSLDPTMKVGRQLLQARRIGRRYSSDQQFRRDTDDSNRDTDDDRAISDALRGVDLDPHIARRYPHQLSGGQRQRIMLAMAMLNEPELIICDEPTTALDVTVQAKVLDTLTNQLDHTGAACIFISHDLAVVAQVCTRIIVLRNGSIIEMAPTEQLLADPQSDYTAALIAASSLDQFAPASFLPVYRGSTVPHSAGGVETRA